MEERDGICLTGERLSLHDFVASDESSVHARGELGYVFDRDVWSRGYATEAGRLLLRFGFESLRLRRIAAACRPENVASARVLEKIGMRYEGTLRSHMFLRGTWRDSLLYAAISETTGI
jgi:ribosomal-protein-alanine N-acetyltransferase